MKVTFLGTASCYPTPTRNVSCTAIKFEDGAIWTFDCGECTQVQFQKSALKLGKVNKIFITHLHGDHLFGLPGLLCTLGNGLDPDLASKKTVDIYGPLGLRKYLITSLEIARSAPGYHFKIHELIPGQDQYPPDWNDWKVVHEYDCETGLDCSSDKIESTKNSEGHRFWSIFEDSKRIVKAVAIQHRIPSFAYVIEEKEQPGSLNMEKIKALGVAPGPHLGQLKNGKTVTVGDREIKPEEVLGEPIKGRKVVVLGDTCDTSELVHFSENADYVIHEATMEDSLKVKAIEYGHSTPSMAAAFAVSVKAKKLCLTHLSPRYKPIEEGSGDEHEETAKVLLDEAKAHISKFASTPIEVEVAYDFFEDTIERKKK